MARSARLRKVEEEPAGVLRQGAASLAIVVARNPVLVGGTTAFLVALAYVSANALWYQPHFHEGAFFSTRDTAYVGPPAPEEDVVTRSSTTIHIERGARAAVPAPVGDPTVERVQAVLRDLDFYGGKVDGITGPNTRQAIEAYRKTVGLPVSGDIDDTLLEQLGAATAGIAPRLPVPVPRVGPEQLAPEARPAASPSGSDPRIVRIQAGLKAFGNDDIEIDGIVGARTKSAIREFQSLFGLPVTGEPDEVVYRKMREIGLTN
ncbi:peptidoglycan-binding domain-containing protein [Mesorhizobium sp. L-8-3]|uniref:peptidoglycan-binding domain-containing protein n=1 Tax=Mesorhizobium sp. L-8-3 TaxID=2744522 RepID=UPI00192970DD|nr:peptidoglycan-binding protein [Mesorhizobium sp. L-8-3]BCH26029.1 peptidoglycan-binding protein [Mesorhizobium sp. L-8-3]